MLIRIEELKVGKPKLVNIQGDEDWLSPLYEQLRSEAGEVTPRLTGDFSIELLDACVHLQGSYKFSPVVKCSRCSSSMVWPIQEKLSLYFSLQADDLSARERDLTAKDLDDYFLLDNQVDLESVINESVQLSFPLKLKCDECKATSEDEAVYRSDEKGQDVLHPFAKLRELKLSD